MELLVVIALLVILAAIIWPVMVAVAERARRTICSSNLRQLGLAWRMYADDHDGVYFWQDDWEKEETFLHWGVTVSTNVRWPFALLPYIRAEGIYRCPGDTGPEYWRILGPKSKWYLSYGPNATLCLGFPRGVGGSPRTEASIHDPNAVIALGESMTGYACCEPWNTAYFRGANYSGQQWDWYEFRDLVDHAREYHLTDEQMARVARHGVGNNAVMLDGHVQWWRWNKLGDANSDEWKQTLGAEVR